MDYRCQGFVNPATQVAHLCLNNDSRHQNAMLAMARADRTVNPKRLETYFYKQRELVFPEWAMYGDGFPEHDAYRYRLSWAEIAGEFDKLLCDISA